MKKMKKLVVVVLAVAMMAMCLVACGVEKDVLGDWTISKINGQEPAAVAEANGVTLDQLMMNWKFESKTVTLTGSTGTQTFDPSYKSNGVELRKDGNLQASMLYDENAKTLTFKFDNGSEYVLTKGTYTFGQAAAPADQGGSEGGEEQPAEGGEEAVEE